MQDTERASEYPRVDRDITRAETLPGWVHGSRDFFRDSVCRIFGKAWGFIASSAELAAEGTVRPLELFPGSVGEPLVLTRAADGLVRALSNVCTHRANLVQGEAATCGEMRCGYHGRRFDLDGTLRASPGFEGAQALPAAKDNLPRVPCGSVGPALFAALDPGLPLAEWSSPLHARLGHLPWDRLRPLEERDRDFEVESSWILYVENYLEGFHVPFVHPGLSAALDLSGYTHELLDWGTLQVAEARRNEPALPGSPLDGGRRIAAHYLWLFPTTMWNIYPWGLSLNAVEPMGVARTRVRFRSYVWDEDLLDRGAGADLWQVEMEDEAVVEACQRGNTAQLFGRGRYAPRHELGVHRFHRLLLEVLQGGWSGAHQRA